MMLQESDSNLTGNDVIAILSRQTEALIQLYQQSLGEIQMLESELRNANTQLDELLDAYNMLYREKKQLKNQLCSIMTHHNKNSNQAIPVNHTASPADTE